MNSKKIIKYGVYTVIVLCLLLLATKACDIYDSYSVLKGQHIELQQEFKAIEETNQKEITEYQARIIDRNKKIQEITATVALKNEKINELHIITDKLEQSFANLIPEEDKVDNLQKQVNFWKDKFTLAESIIKDKDEIIFNLIEKYNAQVKISLNYKELYEKSQGLVLLGNERLKMADRKIKSARLGSSIKTIAIGAIAGLVIYKAVK